MRILLLASAALSIAACSSPAPKTEQLSPTQSPQHEPASAEPELPKLEIGMSRDGVLQALGKPASVRTEKGREVLVYLIPTSKQRCFDSREEYWVVISKKRVEQFGTAASLTHRPTIPFLLDLQQPVICPN